MALTIWSEDRARWWDGVSAFVLAIASFAVTTRLVVSDWTDHLGLTYNLTFLGLLAGLALGRSLFATRWVALMAMAFGLFAVPWQFGLLFPPGIEWRERVLSLAGRLLFAANQLIQEQSVPDPILFLIFIYSMFFILPLMAGFALTREGNAWWAILPSGVVALIVHAYDQCNTAGGCDDSEASRRFMMLAIYATGLLFLVARTAYLRRRAGWLEARVFQPPEVSGDFAQAAVIAAIVLVALAWSAPLMGAAVPAAQDFWQRTSRPWTEFRDRLGNAVSSLRASLGVVSDYYGDTMALGRGNVLNDTLVFSVRAPASPPAGVRYYWRARAYDVYQNGSWHSSVSTSQLITPRSDEELDFGSFAGRWRASFSIVPGIPLDNLYAPPQPESASRPANYLLGFNNDDTVDVLAMETVETIYPGETYQVTSSVSAVSILNLRSAGANYPRWVTDRYLQLPPEITPRTRALAEQIAGDAATPYDAAVLITDYLRNNIEYTETVSAPPSQEPLDWFLFDHQAGFCNYYASAEVILLRSVGIPARVGVGYAQGRRQFLDGTAEVQQSSSSGTTVYLVQQRDAHTWAEVFFPGYGWVEFEPTVSQDPIVRPEEVVDNNANSALQPPAFDEDKSEFLNEDDGEQPAGDVPQTDSALGGLTVWQLRLLAIWLGIVVVAALAVVVVRLRIVVGLPPLPIAIEAGLKRMGIQPPRLLAQWARRASLHSIECAYQEINGALQLLGIRSAPGDTPHERAQALCRILPVCAPAAWQLLDQYHSFAYAGQSGNAALAQRAAATIRWNAWREAAQRLINGTGRA